VAEVKWLPKALDDIDSIAEYISKDSVRYAEQLVAKIFERAELLETNPLIGRIVPEFRRTNLRELILGNYRIVYLVYKDRIDIIRVYHSKRKMSRKNLFE
jgi:addiction module RelE/StbE family toxin